MVSAARRRTDEIILPNSSMIETRWNAYVTRKVNILIRRVLRDRFITFLSLSKLGLDISSIMCPVCDVEVEQLDHLFLKYEFAIRTWDAVFKCLSLQKRKD